MDKDIIYKTSNRNLYKSIIKILKIAVGGSLAILIADNLELKYSTSAGIILLLTILDTSKETIAVTLKRVIAFGVALAISFCVFRFIGYNTFAMGIFLLIFLACCYYFNLLDAISMNAVLVTHYLMEGHMDASLIRNEALLLLIGGGIGTILNLYIPSDVKYIRFEQELIEGDIKAVLSKMSYYIVKEDKRKYSELCFCSLEEHINAGITYAYANMKNTFFQDSRYFVEYMEMRKQQSYVLHQIHSRIKEIEYIAPQAYEVAEFIAHVSDSLSESNNVKHLLEELDILYKHMEYSDLPTNRREFETRALLYIILKDFEMFLKLKEEFVEELSEEQKTKYWVS